MKDIHNNPLFTEITAEEEVSVQGGAVPWALIAGVSSTILTGGLAGVSGGITAAWNWLATSGNGIIFGDKKGTSNGDLRRAGKGIFNVQDLPNGWNWGIVDRNEWVMGGYKGPKPR